MYAYCKEEEARFTFSSVALQEVDGVTLCLKENISSNAQLNKTIKTGTKNIFIRKKSYYKSYPFLLFRCIISVCLLMAMSS